MNRPEQQLQRAILEYLGYALPRYLVLHVPNGGGRTVIEGAVLKGLGVLAGAADLLVLGHAFSGCLELKAGKGRESRAQLAFRDRCAELGIPYAVVRSIDETEETLLSWGLEVRARVS